ncbi:MAG TPA: hypothetical protein DIU15_01880 [Deltaproteobacteria bacterium]|nr:hypothetical protein [Deltaproteobacteria bacterium]HCP44769.1 hypothetical protein [Deltaproteobacteria bacterium]|tara:strand:+ start:2475 stop:3332 length:858 start_codon:yes stop_codon:yes gene_type:complete
MHDLSATSATTTSLKPLRRILRSLSRIPKAWVVGLVALRLGALAAVLFLSVLWKGCVPMTDQVHVETSTETSQPDEDNDEAPLPPGEGEEGTSSSGDGCTESEQGCEPGEAPEGSSDDEQHEDDQVTSSDDDEAEETTELVLSAREGEWIVIESELTVDECGLSDSVNRGQPGATMDLVHTGVDTFDLTFHEGNELVHCGLTTTHDYDCETSHSTDDTPSSLGLDAEILVAINSEGAFPSTDTLELQSTVELACQGPQCVLVQFLLGSSFPCSMVMVSQMASASP